MQRLRMRTQNKIARVRRGEIQVRNHNKKQKQYPKNKKSRRFEYRKVERLKIAI